jgi:pimeloyl-ACP methyl ester carboxylesterase
VSAVVDPAGARAGVNGTPLAHLVSGDGPPLVLLNGGMMSFPAWEPLAAPLRERFRLLGFDFRGQLQSPGTPPPDLLGHARDLVALLDSLGWESAHLLGASFGGLVATEVAAAFPGRVRSLVVVTAMDRETPAFREGSDEMRRVLADVRSGGDRGRFYDLMLEGVYAERFLRQEAATFAARRAQVDKLPLAWFEGVDSLLASLEGFDLADRAAGVRCPALVVIAGEDRVMAPERSRALARALGAEVVEHPTAGHGLVAEDPSWLAGVALDFLARREPVHLRP